MIDKILSFKGTDNIVSIFSNKNDTDRFSVGFVVDVSNTHLLLASITPYGFNDGFILKELDSIYKLEYNGVYQRKLSKLYSLNGQKQEKYNGATDNLIDSLLQYAKSQGLIVAVELLYSGINDIQGLVERVADNTITFQTISEYGCLEEGCMAQKNTITKIICNSEDEKAIKMLFESSYRS